MIKDYYSTSGNNTKRSQIHNFHRHISRHSSNKGPPPADLETALMRNRIALLPLLPETLHHQLLPTHRQVHRVALEDAQRDQDANTGNDGADSEGLVKGIGRCLSDGF